MPPVPCSERGRRTIHFFDVGLLPDTVFFSCVKEGFYIGSFVASF